MRSTTTCFPTPPLSGSGSAPRKFIPNKADGRMPSTAWMCDDPSSGHRWAGACSEGAQASCAARASAAILGRVGGYFRLSPACRELKRAIHQAVDPQEIHGSDPVFQLSNDFQVSGCCAATARRQENPWVTHPAGMGTTFFTSRRNLTAADQPHPACAVGAVQVGKCARFASLAVLEQDGVIYVDAYRIYGVATLRLFPELVQRAALMGLHVDSER